MVVLLLLWKLDVFFNRNGRDGFAKGAKSIIDFTAEVGESVILLLQKLDVVFNRNGRQGFAKCRNEFLLALFLAETIIPFFDFPGQKPEWSYNSLPRVSPDSYRDHSG
jgi:hypothetical protein